MISQKITFVIVNYNGARFLPGCIESIMNQSLKLDQIIVVDNHSTDNSTPSLQRDFPSVEVFVMPRNVGLTDAYNFGIEKSRNDWVIVSNNDIILEKNCVEVLWNSTFSPRVITTPLFVSMNPPHAKQTYPVRFVPSLNHPWSSLKLRYEMGGSYSTDITGFGMLLLNRNEVGSIDSRFPLYFNEDDFSLECRRKGIEIVLVSGARVFHYGSGTLGKLSLRKVRLFMNGWLAFRIKQMSLWDLFPSTVFALILQFYQHLFAAIQHEEIIAPDAQLVNSNNVKLNQGKRRQ